MPELKNLFIKGKMNKDLDERLVPQGEYRDALNIDVAFSEGSNTGAIEPILGHTGLSDYFYNLTNAHCVGSVTDTETNKAYALVYSPSINIIVEYDILNDTRQIVLADTGSILNFSPERIITGISVLDGIIYYTDNHTEPKEIDVEYWKKKSNLTATIASGDAGQNTITLNEDISAELSVLIGLGNVYLYGVGGIPQHITAVSVAGTVVTLSANLTNSGAAINSDCVFSIFYTTPGLLESRIALIKKSPINAPTLILKNTKSSGLKTYNTNIPFNYVDTNPSTAGDQPLKVGDTANQLWVGSSINYDLINDDGWVVGNQIKIYNDNYDAFAVAELTAVDANSYSYEIKTIVGDFPDESIIYKHSLIEDPILYEFNFARFAYRWKFEINGIIQYSLISPFSEVAFIPSTFKYNTLKGFNLGMENSLQKVTLNNLDPKPNDVIEVEILVKYSNNTNIYKIAELTTETEYSFEKEIKGEIIPSNQLLRNFDSIPRKAKALETSGNRLIFANYVQNFNVVKPTFEVNLVDRAGASNEKQSIKSKRNYEIAAVYLDEYQRQTPVLADTSGALAVPYGGGDSVTSLFNPSQFEVKITSAAPAWATHYRYFIKENTNEYYNLALATVDKTDNGFYYLGFPSSEVNKISEGDFLIMKKSFNNKVVNEFEKNKIVSIYSEAPDEVKLKKNKHFVQNHAAFCHDLGDSQELFTKLAGGSPAENSNEFIIGGARAVPGTYALPQASNSVPDYQWTGLTADANTKIQEAKFVRFSVGNAHTKYYRINKFVEGLGDADSGGTPDDKQLKITLEEYFGPEIDILYEYEEGQSGTFLELDDYVLKPNITVEFFKELDNSYKYNGLFFVKLQENAVLKENLQLDTKLKIVDGTTLYNNFAANGTYSGYYIVGGGKSGVPDPNIDTSLGGAQTFDNIDWQLTLTRYFSANIFTFEDSLKIGAKIRFKDYQGRTSTITKEQNFRGVATLTIINGGTGYSDGTNITVSGGDGEDLTLNTTTAGGEITTVVIGNNPGIRYKNGNIITVSGGDGNAKIEVTVVEEEVYTITDMRIDSDANQYFYHLNFDKNFIKDLPFEDFDINSDWDLIEIEVLEEKENFDLTEEKQPPIFETLPEESPLELYYETQETWPIAEHGNFNTLKWFNCFSFSNGVESNRIRDDYNAIQIDKGPKVSATFEEEYKEERVKNGLIFSGIYNRKNGVNRLNQFIIAENITKEINPVYGNIQKLNTRDGDLTILCDDKILKAPIRKDLLFQADGNPQVLSVDRFIGTIIPYSGNYGCQNPESFANYTYKSYFVDKTRGKVLRLSLDGITEISNYGIRDYISDICHSHRGYVHGSFDTYKNQYNISFRAYSTTNLDESAVDKTITFSESINGWVSFKSWIQESGFSLNNRYITFKNGNPYKHHNTGASGLHGASYKSNVTFLLNGSPGNIKNFRTLNYQGEAGWTATNISTDKQTGNVSSFIEKEGIYYNYISGETQSTKASLDLKALNVQGLGTPTSISVNDATFAELPSLLQPGDKVYNNSNNDIRTVQGISGNTITLDAVPTNAFSYFAKDNRFNTSGVLGYYAQIKMETTNNVVFGNRPELYSVGSEVSLSS